METVNNQDIINVLIQAKSLIGPDGAWVQNSFKDYRGGFCAVGAVREVISHLSFDNYDCGQSWRVQKGAEKALAAVLPLSFGTNVIRYNDKKGRQKKFVLALFDKAISNLKMHSYLS